MTLFEKVSENIKAAMKKRDKVVLETLHNTKKIFPGTKAAPGANDILEGVDTSKIVQKLAKQDKEPTQTHTDTGRRDLVDAKLAQVSVIERYLSEQLSEAEIREIVKTIIE